MRRRGFTLLEVVLATAILAIAATTIATWLVEPQRIAADRLDVEGRSAIRSAIARSPAIAAAVDARDLTALSRALRALADDGLPDDGDLRLHAPPGLSDAATHVWIEVRDAGGLVELVPLRIPAAPPIELDGEASP